MIVAHDAFLSFIKALAGTRGIAPYRPCEPSLKRFLSDMAERFDMTFVDTAPTWRGALR